MEEGRIDLGCVNTTRRQHWLTDHEALGSSFPFVERLLPSRQVSCSSSQQFCRLFFTLFFFSFVYPSVAVAVIVNT